MYNERVWSKGALIPLWVLHIIFELVYIAIFAFWMMNYAGTEDKHVPAVHIFFMLIFAVALISEPLEMVLMSFRLLEPMLYLSFQMAKAILSTAYLGVVVNMLVKKEDPAVGDWANIWKIVSVVGLVFLGCMALSFFASLIYGAIVLKRHRKAKAKGFVVKTPYGDAEDDDD